MLQGFLYLLPCLVCLLWAIPLLIRWKENLIAQKIWAIASLLAAINAFYWTHMVTSDFEIYTYISMVISFTNIGFYCLLYLFYLSLIYNRPFTWKHYLVLSPALLFGILNVPLILMIGQEDLVAFMEALITNNWSVPADIGPLLGFQYLLGSTIGTIIAILVINFLLVILITRLIGYHNKREQFFNLSEKQSEKQSWAVLYGLFALLVIMLVYTAGDFLYSIEDYIPFSLLFPLQGGLFFYISYHVYYLDKS